METILTEKFRDYIISNNPELAAQLQADYSVTAYLSDKVASVLPMVERMLAEGKPTYIIEELCMEQMTLELRPSRFNYIRSIIEEEFKEDFARLEDIGILTYEVINLIGDCSELFESFNFSIENEEDRFLRYAVIAKVHDYFN